MSDKFKKLKRKYVLGSILKSLVCGLSFGLFAVGVVLLALKLSANSLDTVWYVLIGVGVAILGGGVAFIFFRPTNKRVATRIDNEFALEERVQTSLEFSDREGTIVELQREDTEKRLKTLPKSKFRLAGIWQFCLVVFIAVAMAVTAFTVPTAQAAEPPVVIPPEDRPRTVTEIELQSVRDIIAVVSRSEIKSEAKEAAIGELNELLVVLENDVKTEGQLSSAISTTVVNINNIFNGLNTFSGLSAALEDAGAAELAKVVLNGSNSYSTYEMMTADDLTFFHDNQGSATATRMKSGIDALNAKLGTAVAEGLADEIDGIVTPISSVLLDLEESNGLYAYLNEFVNTLTTEYEGLQGVTEVDGGTEEAIHGRLSGAVGTFNTRAARELADQSYHGAMRRFIGNRLRYIFRLGGYELPEELIEDSGGGNGSGDSTGPGESDGGTGSGENRGGTDDEIYDPRTRTYEKYMDIISEYAQMIEDMVREGKITPEQANIARAFFNYLQKVEDN